MDEYEYAPQWLTSNGDWVKSSHWSSLNYAEKVMESLLSSPAWNVETVRMVRRRKAGPVEVVDSL